MLWTLPPEPYINNFDLERKPQSENLDGMPAERKDPIVGVATGRHVDTAWQILLGVERRRKWPNI